MAVLKTDGNYLDQKHWPAMVHQGDAGSTHPAQRAKGTKCFCSRKCVKIYGLTALKYLTCKQTIFENVHSKGELGSGTCNEILVPG